MVVIGGIPKNGPGPKTGNGGGGGIGGGAVFFGGIRIRFGIVEFGAGVSGGIGKLLVAVAE